MSEPLIRTETFVASIGKTFGSGRLRVYPKGRTDRLCFLGAAAFALFRETPMSENEVNAALASWLQAMEAGDALDHVTMRRYLVDERFLARSKDGTGYHIDQAALLATFAEDIATLDVAAIAAAAEADRLARKDAWAERAKDS